MADGTRLEWLGPAPDEQTRREVRRVVQAVVDLGGSVGWPDGVTGPEIDAWLDDRLAAGDRVCVLRDGPAVVALGRWQRYAAAPFRRNASVRQVMTDPGRRGRGHGRAVGEVPGGGGRGAGVESLLLSVRGNNHGAEALYRSLGFVEVGVWAGMVAVGSERFDAVWYQLVLGRPDGVVAHGRERVGPGAS